MASQSSACTSGSSDGESGEVAGLLQMSSVDLDTDYSADSPSPIEKSCERAREAAERALETAAACKKLVELIGEIAAAGERNNSAILQKMKSKPEGTPEHNSYRVHVECCDKVLSFLRRKLTKLNTMIFTLGQAAESANKAAKDALETARETTVEACRQKVLVCWSIKFVNADIKDATLLEYRVLRIVRKYYSMLTTEPNMQPVVPSEVDSDEYEVECENKVTKTRYAILGSFIVGVAVLGCLGFFKTHSKSFAPLLITGTLLVAFPSIYWTYRLYRCWKSTRRQNRVLETRMQMRMLYIDERLNTLKEYFREKNITQPRDPELGAGPAYARQ